MWQQRKGLWGVLNSLSHALLQSKHGLDYDLNLDKLIRHSGGGARNTNMAGAAGGAASSSGL
jgi:hypothetical protein